MPERIEALVKPHMLVWAREKSVYDIIGAAKRLKVSPEHLRAWEDGDKRPTINQALGLANLYKWPLSLFYLNSPPSDFSVAATDFRRLPNTETPPQPSPGLLLEQRVAAMQRQIMIDLSEQPDSGDFIHLGSISLAQNPERTAQQVRDILGVDWLTQQRWRTPYDALNGWRLAIEQLNVLVFHTSHQGITFNPPEARGFSTGQRQLPVIVVNGKDAPNARTFTLLHEFTHLLLNRSGLCDCREEFVARTAEQHIEMFCNRSAGAILVPLSLLIGHEVVGRHKDLNFWTDDELQILADDFSVR